MPRHVDALHRQLDIDRAADAHDRHVRRPLPRPEAELGRRREEPVERDLRPLRAGLDVLEGVRRVVEERPRLDKAAERSFRRIGAERYRAVVEVGQKRVGPVEAQAAVELLEHVAQDGVRPRGSGDLLAGARERFRRARVLAHGEDLHVIERGDRLARRGDDAPDLVDLVAEEVDAHGIGEIAGEHVERAAVDAEGAGAVELAGVDVAAVFQSARCVLEGFRDATRAQLRRQGVRPLARGVGELASRLDHERRLDVCGSGRQRAHERAGTCDHHPRLPARERPRRLHPARDLAGVGRLRGKRRVGALGKEQHPVLAQVGGDIAGEGDRALLARYHGERGLRTAGELGSGEEGPGRRGDAEGGVLAGVELVPEVVERAGLGQHERKRIDEHLFLFPRKAAFTLGADSTKSRIAAREGASGCGSSNHFAPLRGGVKARASVA